MQTNPAYTQLYHKDGNRKEDLTRLPLYAPKGQTAPLYLLRHFQPSSIAICLYAVSHSNHARKTAVIPLRQIFRSCAAT